MTDEQWYSKFWWASHLKGAEYVLLDGPKTYAEYYEFWFAYLVERCVNIFKWTGLPFPQRHLEILLIGCGYAGLCKLNNSVNPFDVVQCSMSGPTNYPSEFTTAIGTTPLTQVMFHIYGMPKSNELVTNDGIIANNNDTRTPLFPLIAYYANILAHIDLSIVKVAIKMRTDALIKGGDSSSVDAITSWYKAIEQGSSIGILDKETYLEISDGITVNPLGGSAQSEMDSLVNARVKYVNEFFSDIGVNSVQEKKERLISNEVSVGFNRVMFNVSNMDESRQRTAEQLSELFKESVSVELNPKLDIDLSNVVSTQNTKGADEDD